MTKQAGCIHWGQWIGIGLGIVGLCLLAIAPPAWADLSQASGVRQILKEGVTAFQMGEYDQAEAVFSRAIAQDQHNGIAYGNRCLTNLELHRYHQAIADCTTAIQLAMTADEPFVIEAWLNRGLAYYRSKNYADAIADYSHVLRVRPQEYRAAYNRGLAYVEQNAYAAAMQDYQTALQTVSPTDETAIALLQNDLGVAHLMSGQPELAVAAFTQSIQLNPLDIRAFFNRGCAYHRLGQEMLALHDLYQVTQIDPHHAQAYLHQGLIQYELGQTAAAITSLGQAAQRFLDQNEMTNYQRIQQLIDKIQSPDTAIG
jgi:tetratricopeptide (TPR) repeat protein